MQKGKDNRNPAYKRKREKTIPCHSFFSTMLVGVADMQIRKAKPRHGWPQLGDPFKESLILFSRPARVFGLGRRWAHGRLFTLG